MNILSKYQEMLLNLNHIDSNSIILDIGANVGDIADLLFKKFNSNIFCYEPNIGCCKYMINRFKNNPKIKVFNFAVSNFTGTSFLYFHKKAKDIFDYNQRSTLKPQKDGIDINKKISVKCLDIKKILSAHEKIDLIKLDVEGSEYEIMPKIIENKEKVEMVICETHGNPEGKKIPNADGSKLVIKNQVWVNDHKKLINKLKSLNLYENWFYEWY